MTTQIKAGVIAANAVNSSELASGALSGQNFTGDVTFDTTTLVVDSSNNRVGIGTSSPSTALEVTGTVTSDGLTVDGNAFNFNKTTSDFEGIYFNDASNNGSAVLSGGSNAQALRLWTDRTDASNFGYFEVVDGASAKKMLLVDDSGDISFYEDTGTTAKFFWDAGAESLEIGSIETATNFPLIVKSGTNDHAIAIEEASGGETWQLGVNVNGDLGFYNSGATISSVSFIDGAGQVLIGEDTGDAFNDDAMLRLQRAGDRVFQSFKVDADQEASIFFGDVDDDIECGIVYQAANQNLILRTGNNDEAMRIDSSGNVGIGTSSPSEPLHVQEGSSSGITSRAGTILLVDGSGNTKLSIASGTTSTGELLFGRSTDNDAGRVIYDHSANNMSFYANSSERMRIDSSGNVGIAAVPSGEAAAAHVVRLGDQVCITEYDDGSNPEQFNLFHNSDSSETYIETGTASVIQQRAGEIIFKNAASGSAGAAISFSERMRITTSGTMGFGMQPLGTNNGSAFFDGNVSSKDGFMTTASDLTLIQPSAGNSIFVRDNGNESMRIDSDGIMLLGTTTREIGFLGNVNKFGVAGGSNSIFPMVVFADQDTSVEGSSTILELSYDSDVSYSSANYALFSDQTATQGSISGTGAGTVAYNTSSDERIKENIVDTVSQLEIIKQIQVRDFNYIGNNTTTTGMIAQELNTIIPNVVVEGGDDATKHPWGIDYGKLTPYLIKAIQEQQTIIDDLKSRLDEAGL